MMLWELDSGSNDIYGMDTEHSYIPRSAQVVDTQVDRFDMGIVCIDMKVVDIHIHNYMDLRILAVGSRNHSYKDLHTLAVGSRNHSYNCGNEDCDPVEIHKI
jgi:hypothetical protein